MKDNLAESVSALTVQINNLQGSSDVGFEIMMWALSIIITMMGWLLWLFLEKHVFGVVFGLGVVFMALSLIGILSNDGDMEQLIELRDNIVKQKITKMSCKELMQDLILTLENERPDFIEEKYEWQKDLYYTKCEISLREELLKLSD